ncbi:hypothetical protein BGX34_010021 [Mortierella sp. NVP85]|nr:hypothetical protein BGX34_010021 [Mortierella sp. NVP85]
MAAAANLPDELKHIGTYLQRAAEIQERDPIISYYATYYAAKLAVPKTNQSNRATVEQLLVTLEKQKKSFGDNEAISNDLVGYAHIENFALRIFTMADNEDRNGQSSKKTARNFVAAANYLEILKVFGDIDSEVEGKIKYSKWRAAEILKAIRDGRQPAPPPDANKPKEEPSFSPGPDQSLEGFSSSSAIPGTPGVTGGFGEMNISGTPFSPATVVPHVLPVTPQPIHRAALDAPTITDFPSPPIASADAFGIINNQNLIGGGNFGDNTFQNPVNNMSSNWNMPTGNPSQDQGQNFYNPAGSPHVLPPQQPPSNFISAAAQPPPPAPSSGYMPTGSNPMSPASNMSNVPFGYGANNNNNNNLYQAPVAPSPGPSVPAQPPYGQPAFTAPSAPFQQPQPSSQQPYTPIPIVLDPEVNTKVQKHCKWTISALTYDDVPAAIDNLEKALALLRPYHNKQ